MEELREIQFNTFSLLDYNFERYYSSLAYGLCDIVILPESQINQSSFIPNNMYPNNFSGFSQQQNYNVNQDSITRPGEHVLFFDANAEYLMSGNFRRWSDTVVSNSDWNEVAKKQKENKGNFGHEEATTALWVDGHGSRITKVEMNADPAGWANSHLGWVGATNYTGDPIP